MRLPLDPRKVERRSTQDTNALLGAMTLSVATIVLLAELALLGPTSSIIGLLALTLSAESATVVIHARSGGRAAANLPELPPELPT